MIPISRISLPLHHRTVLGELVPKLAEINGVAAIALGGSWADGTARPDSDLDIGLFYDDAAPPDIPALNRLLRKLDEGKIARATGLYEWGPWMNGGAWARIDGIKVDLIYRSFDHVARVIEDCKSGHIAHHYRQQPAFGFLNQVYLAEIAGAVVLHDPGRRLYGLRKIVRNYPGKLRRMAVADAMSDAEFTLAQIHEMIAGNDIYSAVGSLTRTAFALARAWFALEKRYYRNDKQALMLISQFENVPRGAAARLCRVLATGDAKRSALEACAEEAGQLFAETVPLTQPRYHLRFGALKVRL